MTTLEVGKTYVLFIPPSWIIGGTVKELNGVDVVLTDVVYLENFADHESAIGSLPLCADPKRLTKIATVSHPMPDNTIIRRDAILIATPCATNLRPLARKSEADAIRNTK